MHRTLLATFLIITAGCCDKCKQKPTVVETKTVEVSPCTNEPVAPIERVTYSESDTVRESTEREYTTREISDRSSADQTFVTEAALANLTEVELGRQAVRSATNDEVRRFGQRMIDDHNRNQSDLQTAAQKAGLEVPSSLDGRRQDTVNDLTRYSGADFDREFLTRMVSDHQKAVAKFEDASKNAKSNDVRDYALNSLPTVKDHLRSARDINDRLKGR